MIRIQSLWHLFTRLTFALGGLHQKQLQDGLLDILELDVEA